MKDYDLNPKNSISSLDCWLLEMYSKFRKEAQRSGNAGKLAKLPLGEQLAIAAVENYQKSLAIAAKDSEDINAPMIDLTNKYAVRADFFMHISGFIISALPEYSEKYQLVKLDRNFEPTCFIIRQSTFTAVNDTKDLTETFKQLSENDEFLDANNFTVFIDLMGIDAGEVLPSLRMDNLQFVNSPRGILINHGRNSAEGLSTFTVVNTDSQAMGVDCWVEGSSEQPHHQKLEQLAKKLLVIGWCEPSTPVKRIPKSVLGQRKPRSGTLQKHSKPFSIFHQKILNPRLGKNYGKGGGGRNKPTDRFWLVRGFWRMQNYGSRLLNRTRKIWIAPHYRGNKSGTKINQLIIK